VTAPGAVQPLYRLPPRPGLLDWLWAGAGAGLVFGLAELVVAIPAGSALDPRLAALVLGMDCAAVALGSLLVGVVLRAREVRVSRSGLVGAVVGPLLFAAVSGRIWRELASGGHTGLLGFAGLMTAALFATSAGLVSSRLADALERRGVVCAAIYVWGGVSLPLAASERLAHEVPFSGYVGALSALALVLSAAAVAWLGVEIARLRESRPARTFGGLLSWLVLLSVGTATSPTWLPWVFYDREAPKIAVGPPNFLVAAMPDAGGSMPLDSLELQLAAPALAQLAFEGSSYEIAPDAAADTRADTLEPGVGVLLTDSRKADVVPQLSYSGYATAAILPGDAAPAELATAELDARPGARVLLEGPLAWLGAAPLLTGSARPLLRWLGLDTDARGADRLAERAKAWLLDWRMERSGVPFFLFVDFRHAAVPPRGKTLLERSDARLGELLEHLRTLEIDESTLVAVLIDGESTARAGARISRIVVRPPVVARPPIGWPQRTGSVRVGTTKNGQLGDFLIQASRSDGTSPVTLPEFSATP